MEIPETEIVPMAKIYRHKGSIKITTASDISLIELYGFLNIYIKKLEEKVKNEFRLE